MAIALRPLQPSDLPAARQLLAAACPLDSASQVAEEKLFGPAFQTGPASSAGAFEEDQLIGLSVASRSWLRLLAVAPDARGKGIGTALLAAAEAAVAQGGASRIRTCDQPGNYLAPGIDDRNRELIEWLERRDYARVATNCNLLITLPGNPRISDERAATMHAAAADAGYTLRRADSRDRSMLTTTIEASFSAGWAFEVGRALDRSPAGVHIALTSAGQLAAFSAHGGNNHGLGWFGPAGTLDEHRGKGLGAALLIDCLLDIARAGHDTATIAWIGPRDFYDRVAGVAGERHFTVLQKDLSPEGLLS